MSTYTLLVNFRNPADTVALLNKIFGYEMRASKPLEDKPSITWVSGEDDSSDKPALRMCFSHAASRLITEVDSNTGRTRVVPVET